MTNGSFNEYDSERPKWDSVAESNKVEFLYYDENDDYQFEVWKGRNKDREKCFAVRRTNDLPFGDQIEPEDKVEYYCGSGPRRDGDKPAKKVLFRLPELIASTSTVFVVEGEKDVETLRDLDLTATCNPFGALKWLDEFSPWLKDRDVVILQDHDDRGEQHALKVLASVRKFAASVKLILLPGLPEKGDVTDWLGIDGNTPEKLAEIVAAAPFAKPVIHVVAGELARYVEEAETALLVEDIYQQGGRLIRPYTASRRVKGEDVSYVCVIDVSAPWLNLKLAADADFLSHDARAKKEVRKNPPPEVAPSILARVGDWQFPTLAGVINTPTMRPDGTILMEPGYDPATGLFLFNPLKIPAIPEKPTKSECLKALAVLDELLDEVALVVDEDESKKDNAARSAALSMLMTPVLRPAMEVAPFHLVTAPQPGSGKTYLQNLASLIFNGDKQASIAAGKDHEETEKRLSAAALEGQVLICMDNCNRPISGPEFLCQLTENPFVKPRILGKSEAPSIPNAFVVFATGNNSSVEKDMTRRTVICRLDANIEDTTKKVYTQDPVAMIQADRGRYVAAILTIAKGLLSDSDFKQPTPVPSYGDWSRLVRGALMWLDRKDPWKTAESSMASDPQTEALRELEQLWPKAGEITAGELILLANATVQDSESCKYQWPELRACLESILESGNQLKFEATALGYALKPLLDRTIGEKKFFKLEGRKGYAWKARPREAVEAFQRAA